MVGEVWCNCNQILGASSALPFKLRVCNCGMHPVHSYSGRISFPHFVCIVSVSFTT